MDSDYREEAKEQIKAAKGAYGHSHGFMSTTQRDCQIMRGVYHATLAVALTNLAMLKRESEEGSD